MKFWTWEYGRQNGGYSKMLLAGSKRLKFDVYLLRLPTHSIVRPHKDPSPNGYEHHRLNITLKSARWGGVTMIENQDQVVDLLDFIEAPKIYHFRPDQVYHYVTTVLDGEVWLLSIGWLRKAK
jgi:hypothetical protein